MEIKLVTNNAKKKKSNPHKLNFNQQHKLKLKSFKEKLSKVDEECKHGRKWSDVCQAEPRIAITIPTQQPSEKQHIDLDQIESLDRTMVDKMAIMGRTIQ